MTLGPHGDAALWAASQGWHVFPLAPRSKQPAHPRCQDALHPDGRKLTGDALTEHARACPQFGHGFHDATVDAATIADWWREAPTRNVGVSTGPSGLAVVDVDDMAALDNLPLAETLIVETGGGGLHYVYRGDIPCSQGALAPHVDTRGRGGYIVLPPSRCQEHDRPYRWSHLVPPTPIPEWVAAALAKPERPAAPAPAASSPANSAWGERVLHEEVGRIAAAPTGQRNATLFAAGCKVFEAVKGGHIPESTAWDALRRAAEMCGHDGDTELTLTSAWERVEPRHPHERAPLPAAAVAPPPAAQPDTPEGYAPPDPPASRLMSLEQLRHVPPPTWLLPGILPEGTTVLWAPHSSGKTFVALDWSLALAAAGGPVVFCAGEGAAGLTKRIEAWRLANAGLDPGGNFHVLALDNFPHLLRQESVNALYADVHAMSQPPKLVVVDTWARALTGGDENSATDVGLAVAVLEGLKGRFGTSVLILHHCGTTQFPGQTPKRFRGSTALDGAVDAMWRLDAPVEDQPFPKWRLVNGKLKDHEPPAPIEFRLEPYGPSVACFPPAAQIAGVAARRPL